MNLNSDKTRWYNDFYSNKKILKTYPWYNGLMKFLKNATITSDTKILEIGCGAGEFLNTLKNDARCTGIDISTTALRIANSNGNVQRHTFLQSQAEFLPFKDSTFDIIICCEVIEHVNDIDDTLKEMYRVLKSDGKQFISFPNYYNPFYLGVRLLAQLLHQPQWLSLQIMDRFLFYDFVIRKLAKTGFLLQSSKGTCYFHTKIPFLNIFNHFEDFFDRLKLQFLSFHPVLFIKKRNDSL